MPPLLRILDLAKSYAGAAGRRVLRGVGLELAPGEYVAIMGESRVGKSTLLNLIAGLDTPDGWLFHIAGYAWLLVQHPYPGAYGDAVSNWTIAEIVLLLTTVGGMVGWLLNFHTARSKQNRELGKIDVDTFALLREQVGEMEEKIVKLRDRVDTLEEQVDVKDATIKKLENRLNRVLIYVSGLLKELNDKGIQYTPPEPGLLDTDPNIPKVRK